MTNIIRKNCRAETDLNEAETTAPRPAFSDHVQPTLRFIHNIFQLLTESRFREVDKIKTVGSTYLAAAGLKPERGSVLTSRDDDVTDDVTSGQLGALAEFSFAMKTKLQNINENSYNNFVLRVGEWVTWFSPKQFLNATGKQWGKEVSSSQGRR